MFNEVGFSSQRDDFVYFGTYSVRQEAVLSISPVWYWCEKRDWLTDRALPATYSRLSSHHLRLAFCGLTAGLHADFWSWQKKSCCWGVWTSNSILRRLRCCLWSLMQCAEISSHRLEIICTSVWIYHCCWTACLTNCEDCEQPYPPMKNLTA